jgi:hypothetical protein
MIEQLATLRASRYALVITGLAVLAWVVISGAYRDADGFLSGRAALPIAIAGASLIASALVGTALRGAAAWLLVAIVGQAAALRLINAGTGLHYQHYLDWSALASEHALEVSIIGVQAVLAGTALVARRRAVLDWLRTSIGRWQTVVLVAVLIALSATVSQDIRAYARELVTATLIQLVNLTTLVVLVASLPVDALTRARDSFRGWLGDGSDEMAVKRDARPDRFAYACAALSVVIAAVLSAAVYQLHPHVQDEVKYLFQARYFASGAFAAPVPPVPQGFDMFLLEVGPKGWYSVFPPGWPAILAIGVKLGAPWLVNPVLNGVNVVLAYMLLRSVYGLRTARLATLLLVVSPWFVFLGMSLMPHAATLALALIGALGVEWSRRTGRAWYALVGGAAVGFAAIVRQLDGLVIALVLGLWAIGLGGRRISLTATAALVAGTGLVAALTLPYNAMFTGHALAFPVMTYTDQHFGVNSNAYGFGPDRGLGWALDPNPGHSPLDGAINSNLNATALNVELFGWGVGSLVLTGVLLLKGRIARADRAMLAVIVAVIGAYFLNYFSGGPDFGARYWYLVIVPAVVLTARGVGSLGVLLDAAGPRGFGETRALAAVAALTCGAIVAFMPWRALDKYHHYLGMRPDVRQMAQARHFGRSLVLVRGVEHPDYSSAATYNPLDLRANAPIYAHDVSDSVQHALLEAYADRDVWILDGPTRTGAGYRVVEGPVPAKTLLASGREVP